MSNIQYADINAGFNAQPTCRLPTLSALRTADLRAFMYSVDWEKAEVWRLFRLDHTTGGVAHVSTVDFDQACAILGELRTRLKR